MPGLDRALTDCITVRLTETVAKGRMIRLC